jgi:hypothetical protein
MDLIKPLAGIVNDPLFFQRICDYIAGGGTLVEFCHELHEQGHDISYPATLRWIRSDVARRERYELALEDGSEWQIDRIKRELRDLAAVDLSRIFNEDGSQKPFPEWPSDIQRAVSSIKKGKDGTEIKFHDKLKAIELIGRASGAFKEKVEHSGSVNLTLEKLVGQSMAPVKKEES